MLTLLSGCTAPQQHHLLDTGDRISREAGGANSPLLLTPCASSSNLDLLKHTAVLGGSSASYTHTLPATSNPPFASASASPEAELSLPSNSAMVAHPTTGSASFNPSRERKEKSRSSSAPSSPTKKRFGLSRSLSRSRSQSRSRTHSHSKSEPSPPVPPVPSQGPSSAASSSWLLINSDTLDNTGSGSMSGSGTDANPSPAPEARKRRRLPSLGLGRGFSFLRRESPSSNSSSSSTSGDTKTKGKEKEKDGEKVSRWASFSHLAQLGHKRHASASSSKTGKSGLVVGAPSAFKHEFHIGPDGTRKGSSSLVNLSDDQVRSSSLFGMKKTIPNLCIQRTIEITVNVVPANPTFTPLPMGIPRTSSSSDRSTSQSHSGSGSHGHGKEGSGYSYTPYSQSHAALARSLSLQRAQAYAKLSQGRDGYLTRSKDDSNSGNVINVTASNGMQVKTEGEKEVKKAKRASLVKRKPVPPLYPEQTTPTPIVSISSTTSPVSGRSVTTPNSEVGDSKHTPTSVSTTIPEVSKEDEKGDDQPVNVETNVEEKHTEVTPEPAPEPAALASSPSEDSSLSTVPTTTLSSSIPQAEQPQSQPATQQVVANVSSSTTVPAPVPVQIHICPMHHPHTHPHPHAYPIQPPTVPPRRHTLATLGRSGSVSSRPSADIPSIPTIVAPVLTSSIPAAQEANKSKTEKDIIREEGAAPREEGAEDNSESATAKKVNDIVKSAQEGEPSVEPSPRPSFASLGSEGGESSESSTTSETAETAESTAMPLTPTDGQRTFASISVLGVGEGVKVPAADGSEQVLVPQMQEEVRVKRRPTPPKRREGVAEETVYFTADEEEAVVEN